MIANITYHQWVFKLKQEVKKKMIKQNILMLLIVAISIMFMAGCSDEGLEKRAGGLRVVEIDSCEYLVNGFKTLDNYSITHKGNCKFCEERRKKENNRKDNE